MIRLTYGNTNTFYIPGSAGGLLIDTDYAGTLRAFYKTLKNSGMQLGDIAYVLATHYHPDHMGLIAELMDQGVTLLLMEEQKPFVHFSDAIFSNAGLSVRPIDEAQATVLPCRESRSFLLEIGIAGEIVSTPSHSKDSVSLILDDGDCFVGDLEPLQYLDAYESNEQLKADWDLLKAHHPKRIFYGHANFQILC